MTDSNKTSSHTPKTAHLQPLSLFF